ncbi:MAG: vWA domain-containing protein [Burkholderiales bacterium]
MKLKRLITAPTLLLIAALAACAASFDEQAAFAAPAPNPWPPAWQDTPATPPGDFTPPRFEPPSASHCQRAPGTREVPGRSPQQNDAAWHLRKGSADKRRDASEVDALSSEKPAAKAAAPAALAAPRAELERRALVASDRVAPAPQAPEPIDAVVTAGVVDDNADFGAYLTYRQRNTHQPVRERDISERYLLEVIDAQGRPVHDAEVAVQRAGVAEPVSWARTDTAGRAWLHPRTFIAPAFAAEPVLGVAVRKGGAQARATLVRGQSNALQVRLGVASAAQRPRLDLVFMIDATGSMGDEIDKLKRSMRAMSEQIAQLPGQPDICYGLVAYRDRGDAFITRTHDFTDDLGAFQALLAKVQAQGGGDTPEALNEALHEVVHGLAWRSDAARLVVMVADAPPHLDYGGPQYDTDMQAALAKGIKLFAVGASGLDPVGQYVFRQLAQYTAGRFVFLTYKNAADPASGPGTQTVHDVKNYSVQTLDRLVVRLVSEEIARLGRV